MSHPQIYNLGEHCWSFHRNSMVAIDYAGNPVRGYSSDLFVVLPRSVELDLSQPAHSEYLH